MLDGDPVNGYLPGGSVAGVIDDRPTCAELVERIVEEAERHVRRRSESLRRENMAIDAGQTPRTASPSS